MDLASRRVGVVVRDGYQELEFWYPVLRFREEGAAVTVIGADGERTYVSKLGYPVISYAPLSAPLSQEFRSNRRSQRGGWRGRTTALPREMPPRPVASWRSLRFYERATRIAVWNLFFLTGIAGSALVSGYIIQDDGY